jgi:AmiR/NasT family two-component response regulator
MTATHQTSSEPKLEFLEALRRENEQLRTALVTRIVIEQAKGLLAERLQTGVDDAFERLRREARSRRMKLHALAAAVVAGEPWTKTIFPPDPKVTLVERDG